MRIALWSALALLGAGRTLAQEELTRQLWNSEFIGKRPAGTGALATPPNYRRTPGSPQTGAALPAGEATILGLTLWRVRPPRPADSQGTRLLVLEATGDGAGEQVPERLNADTVLAEGNRVRLSVEAATSGYLYIIDRERYANGGLSDPYVIFPNRLTRIDGNRVSPGRLIEIPNREDHPNCFTIRSSRPEQTAEVLTLLITPQPLAEVKVANQPFHLEPSAYREWEKKWAARAERFELEGGAGQAWTPQEKQAGAGTDAALTQNDPAPQSLYRVSAPPGSPLILEIPLQFKN